MTALAEQVTAKGADLPYYNFDKVYSYGGVYIFVCGARGLGKTYGAKDKVIKKFLRKGEQFIYLRRFKTELRAAKAFFDDIAHTFPGMLFRLNGDQFEVCREPNKQDRKKNDWECMGFVIALSTGQNQKGRAFPMVRTIIFDEFIIEKGLTHYLPDESTVLTNFYNTVDRYRNKTVVLFLANSISIENPYFVKYKIRPDKVGDLITKAHSKITGKPWIVAHFVDSAEFNQEVYKTRFGEFIEGTDYGDYALGNEFADNHELMIARKPSDSEYAYTLETRGGTFSVWFHRKEGNYYLQEKRPGQELKYTMLPNKVDTDNRLLLKNDEILRMLRASFKNGLMRFDESHTRNAMLDVFI
jgi:hypothetical protein